MPDPIHNAPETPAGANSENLGTFLPDTDPASYELRMLDPRRVRVFRAGGVTRLTLDGDRSWIRVTIARAFPLSDPHHYVGFLDGAGKDIGMVQDPSHMDHDSRHLLEEELERRYFLPVVERVLSVKEESGVVTWRVETDRGEKSLVVRNLKDSIQELSATRVLVTDVEGNRFEFPDLNKLDGKSLGILMRNL